MSFPEAKAQLRSSIQNKRQLIVQDSLDVAKIAAIQSNKHSDTLYINSIKKEEPVYNQPWFLTIIGAAILAGFTAGLNYLFNRSLNKRQAEYQENIAKMQGDIQKQISTDQLQNQQQIAIKQNEFDTLIASQNADTQARVTKMQAEFELESVRARGVIENLKLIFERKSEVILQLPEILQPGLTAIPMARQGLYTLSAFLNQATFRDWLNQVASLDKHRGILGEKTVEKILKLDEYLVDIDRYINSGHMTNDLLQNRGRTDTDKIRKLVIDVIDTANNEFREEIIDAMNKAGKI